MTRSTENPVAGDLRAKHTLVAPASPSAILAKALADSGRDEKWLAKELGWRTRYVRRLIADRKALSPFGAMLIEVTLDLTVSLHAAQRACERWDAEEERLAEAAGQTVQRRERGGQ